MIVLSSGSLTTWIGPQGQGDRQSLDFRVSVGRKRFEEFIRGYGSISNHAYDVLDITTVSKQRVSGRRQDQRFDLWEFDTLKCVLEWGLDKTMRSPYLECVEIREGLQASDE